MNERRYSEDEMKAIFERASRTRTAQRHQVASGEGFTLAELQDIGREVGIAPESIANAAASLQAGGERVRRTLLGLPIGVARSLQLERDLTEEEWERLVVDLRETFDARGRVRTHGSLRQWTNGNLQALLEPTPDGQRVRLRTFKGGAQALMSGGLLVLGVGVAALVTQIVSGGASLASLTPFLAIGGGMFGAGAIQLPAWARLRSRQMDGVLARLAVMVSSKRSELSPGEPPTEGEERST